MTLPPSSLDILLQVRMQNLEPALMQEWVMRRPFAAVLPMQPILVLPLEEPEYGAVLTFRRKPSSEKGGQDGGLRFSIALTPGEDGEDDGGEGSGAFLVTRISEGQYTNKPFSERAICRALKKDLGSLDPACGEVTSIFDFLEDQQQTNRERGSGGRSAE